MVKARVNDMENLYHQKRKEYREIIANYNDLKKEQAILLEEQATLVESRVRVGVMLT